MTDRKWAVLAVLCLGLLVTGIDGTIVNVALPSLVRELHSSSSQLQWIVDAYTIVFASFLLIAGSTGDRLGRKGTFMLGLAVFGGGSLACSLTHSANTLIATRAVQGLGGACIMPSTLSIITNVFTDANERARAIAIWAGVSGLGVAIGPLTGGYLLGHFWWGSIFLVNVPIIIAALVAAAVLVPESRDTNAPTPDWLGTVLSTTGLVALLYGIIEGPTDGWAHVTIIGAFALAIVLLGGFTLWERHTDHPILDVRFFANPRFTAASVAVTLVFFAMFGSLFFVSQFLQFVLGLSALAAGVRLLPIAVVLMVAAPLSAKLVGRAGSKVVVAAGLGLVGAALLLFSRATDTSGYALVAAVLVLIGLGMGLAMAPATDSIMGSLPPERAGVGSAMNDTTREIGGALGVAVMGSLTASSYATRVMHNPRFAQIASQSEKAAAAIKSSVGGAAIIAGQLPKSAAAIVSQLANDAFVHALDHTVVVAAVVAFLGALVVIVWLPARAAVPERVPADELIINAAQRIPTSAVRRRDLASATLGLLAEAGMSSLSFHGLAARSGYGTATIERYWASRIDIVVLAMNEVFEEHPIPDTGDLRADVRTHMRTVGDVLTAPRARAVVGALVAAAAGDPELERALHDRVVGPRREQFVARLREGLNPRARRDPHVIADVLFGPLYMRALISGDPIDDELIDTLVDLALPRVRSSKAALPAATRSR